MARLLFGTLTAFVILGGCAPPRRVTPLSAIPPTATSRSVTRAGSADDVRADPWAYLRAVHARCRELQHYRLTFTRLERRGVGPFKTLQGPERIACRFRREPFSVYFEWLDPDVKYGVSTFVAGEQDDQVRFVPRHGLFGLPPRLQRVPLWMPVFWGESRNPLTDFGLERMMDLVFESRAAADGPVEIDYQGVGEFERAGVRVHRFRLAFPRDEFETPLQDLYVDSRTDLPVCARLYRGDGRLEAAYVWEDVDAEVSLRDEDFLLPSERRSRQDTRN